MSYRSIVSAMTVLPMRDPIFSEMATKIEITDESGGPYLEVTQQHEGRKILISNEDWPEIKAAIEQMLAICEELEVRGKNEPTP